MTDFCLVRCSQTLITLAVMQLIFPAKSQLLADDGKAAVKIRQGHQNNWSQGFNNIRTAIQVHENNA